MTSSGPGTGRATQRPGIELPRAHIWRWIRQVLTAFVGCLLVIGHAAEGGPPNPILSKFQRQDVPDDHVAEWSHEAKNKVAIPRAEFEQLLKESGGDTKSNAAHITVAQYSATLAGKALRGGRARLTVQRVGDAAVLMPLNQFNLAVQDFAWIDRPAVWGADDDGESWLLADVPQGE